MKNRTGARDNLGHNLRPGGPCPICAAGIHRADYKDPTMLKKFTSEGGRMLPSRITGVCARHQRGVREAIRRSRLLALLPFVFKV